MHDGIPHGIHNIIPVQAVDKAIKLYRRLIVE